MQARTDDLTQLGNRLMFHERLQDVLADREAAENPAAVLAVDLGRFKALNESLGRNIGDALLCLVAKRIRSALTGSDVVARLEADKFGIIQIGQPQPQSADGAGHASGRPGRPRLSARRPVDQYFGLRRRGHARPDMPPIAIRC